MSAIFAEFIAVHPILLLLKAVRFYILPGVSGLKLHICDEQLKVMWIYVSSPQDLHSASAVVTNALKSITRYDYSNWLINGGFKSCLFFKWKAEYMITYTDASISNMCFLFSLSTCINIFFFCIYHGVAFSKECMLMALLNGNVHIPRQLQLITLCLIIFVFTGISKV